MTLIWCFDIFSHKSGPKKLFFQNMSKNSLYTPAVESASAFSCDLYSKVLGISSLRSISLNEFNSILTVDEASPELPGEVSIFSTDKFRVNWPGPTIILSLSASDWLSEDESYLVLENNTQKNIYLQNHSGSGLAAPIPILAFTCDLKYYLINTLFFGIFIRTLYNVQFVELFLRVCYQKPFTSLVKPISKLLYRPASGFY